MPPRRSPKNQPSSQPVQTQNQIRCDQVIQQLERFAEFLDSLGNTLLDDALFFNLEIRLAKIEPLFEEFNSLYIDNLVQCDDSVRDPISFENLYFSCVSKAKRLLTASQTSKFHSEGSSEHTAADISHIKLEPIKIKEFSGDYLMWTEFRDSFETFIHSNAIYSDTEKFLYLKSLLTGEASNVLENLESSALNYKSAWGLLIKRYENKRLIIHYHVKTLFDLPSIQRESFSNLRQLHDDINKHIRALANLGQPIEYWDTILVHLITSKFDNYTMRGWLEYKIKSELPTMEDLKSFLLQKCELLEKLHSNKIVPKQPRKQQNQNVNINKQRSHFSSNNQSLVSNGKQDDKGIRICPVCKSNSHELFQCKPFLDLEISKRIQLVKELKLCINCLHGGHFRPSCRSSRCKRCNRAHNTLLHLEFEKKVTPQKETSSVESPLSLANAATSECESPLSNAATSECVNRNYQRMILLSTAIIKIPDKNGTNVALRALLDSGSQVSCIKETAVKKLGLTCHDLNIPITGIGALSNSASKFTTVTVKSKQNLFERTLSCVVMPKITENVPRRSFSLQDIPIPDHIKLADPMFNQTNEVDVLLGAEIFWEVMMVGQKSLGPKMPILQKTKLGWIIGGELQTPYKPKSFICNSSCSSFEEMNKFWEIEDTAASTSENLNLSKEELDCETFFKQTFCRNTQGRFVVGIPLKSHAHELGDSRTAALRRFFCIERKLQKDETLRKEYCKFMKEYEQLNHMTEISEKEFNVKYFIPHHAVIRETSLTTKVRVVFDASLKTDNGYSFNDIQMVGPTIQSDLFSILIRFRQHQYVLTADAEKMYRQILIRESDQNYQCILWRENPSQRLRCFKLNTVTYGTASAPYLAIRSLYQLGIECEESNELASQVIKTDFYVDDLLTGTNSISTLKQLQRDVSNILSSAGLNLRKYLSNSKEILDSIKEQSQTELDVLELGENDCLKTLGVSWNSTKDTIQFSVAKLSDSKKNVTKREILSSVSKIFDPLGLIGPVTVIGKLLIQQLWQLKLNWDESVPQNIYSQWLHLRNELQYLQDLKIPRCTLIPQAEIIEIHSFSDASQLAYGASVYVRSVDNTGKVQVKLLCAKSRVAPISKPITIPKLELCGAVLSTQLVNNVIKASKIQFSKIFLWSDSQIVIAWINHEPSSLKTFVANRVSEIQNSFASSHWKYVSSADNPADLISRGVFPKNLIQNSLWFSGPHWLQWHENKWPNQPGIVAQEIPERRCTTNIILTAIPTETFDLLSSYSSLDMLKRVFAYCLRFISKLCKKTDFGKNSRLTVQEIENSLMHIVKIAQREHYLGEIQALKTQRQVHRKSHLFALKPFLDTNEVLRVGGRICNSEDFCYDKMHPIILPQNHYLTKLTMKNEHEQLLHCGPQLLLSSIRDRFWPIHGNSIAKKLVNDCIICFKANPKPISYIMGNLPKERLQQCPPFFNVGIDYAGPIKTKLNNTRNSKLQKSYICVFVCFSTKAVHLEVVSDLSTQSFIAVLKRFIARRGRPCKIWSDNGSNFVGAYSEIQELSKFLSSSNVQSMIENHLQRYNVSWSFIPPRAPNFGGLWEACVKSAKYHLKRVIGNSLLTFEQLYTLITEIESILNSRPLSPLSSHPQDYSPLTPGHFLIGRPLTSIPERNVMDGPENRLNKFQLLQRMKQHFWSRWNKEYISQLQVRTKWKQQCQEILQIGQLVLIKEDNTNIPVLQWKLGRVVELHPGKDDVTRVATIQLPNKTLIKRAVSKICVLPLD